MKPLPFLLGVTLAGIIAATIGGTLSLFAWQAKGMFIWGLVLMVLGVLFKALIDQVEE